MLPADKGFELEFDTSTCQKEYEWLGFESRRLIFSFLEACINDPTVTVETMVYELSSVLYAVFVLNQISGPVRQ